MSNAIGELMTIKEAYVKAGEKWREMIENLRNFPQRIRLMKDFPQPNIVSEGHRVIYQWTDVKTFCHFTFIRGWGMLTFGYIKTNENREEVDIVTDNLVFDNLGNVKESTDEEGSCWNMTLSENLEDFFFPKLYAALMAAFEDKQRILGS